MKINPLFAKSTYSNNDEVKNIQIGIARPENYLGFFSFYGEKIEIYKKMINTIHENKINLNDPFINESKILSSQINDYELNFKLSIESMNYSNSPESIGINDNLVFDIKEIKLYLEKNFIGIQAAKPEINLLVGNSEYDYFWPYQLNSIEIEIIKSLKSGKLKLDSLDPKFRSYLYQLGVLIPIQNNKLGIGLNPKSGVFRSVFNQAQVYIINRYYEMLFKMGVVRLGDRDSELRAWTHNDQMGNFLNHLLLPFVSKYFCKEKAEELFCKYIKYLPTSELKIHKDKVDMGLTMSLFLRSTQNETEIDQECAPISVESDTDHSVFNTYCTKKGDIVFFFGFERQHFRPPLSTNETTEAILLNYRCI